MKPPKEMRSRVQERKQENKDVKKNPLPVRPSNMDKKIFSEKGKSFLKNSPGTKSDGNHRIDADVTKHSKGQAVPNQQWEMILNVTPEGIPDDPATAFCPMPGRIRPREHMKVNECDY